MMRRRSKYNSLGKRLKLFLVRASELEELEYVKNGMKSQIKLFSDPNDELSKNPSEEQIRSFLLLFRQFISNSEPLFINRIFNDAQRAITNHELKSLLVKYREDWIRDNKYGPFEIRLNDERLSPEEALDLLINAHYFHTDEVKRQKLEKFGIGPNGLPYIHLVTTIPRLVCHILNVASVIKKAFEINCIIDNENG